MKNVSSTLFLLLSITFVAVAIFAYREAANDSKVGRILLILIGPIAIYCFLSAILFLVLYPLGAFNKYVYQQVSGPESPFASERLPSQIIAPRDQEDGK
jgi:hypothetical protein